MKKSDIPCTSDCPKRSPTCHTNCPDYFKFRSKVKLENAKVKKVKDQYNFYREIEIRRHSK